MKTGTMARSLGFLIVLIQLQTSAAIAQTDVKALAREHFQKGVAAFNDKRFGEAASEFDEAYRLSPATVVLYNIGQVDVILGRPVEAVATFERYLAEGAASIPTERQAEVRAEIDKQRTRIGTVTVSTQPAGAQVRVDGLLVGKTPLAHPISVAAGKHTIEAQLPRYAPQVRELDVAGKARVEIELRLRPVLPIASEPSGPPVGSVLPAPTQVVTPLPSSQTQALSIAAVQPPSEEKTSRNWRRTSGYIVAGIGILAAITGGVVAIQSASAAGNAKDRAISAADAKMPVQADLNSYDQAKLDFDAAKSRNRIGWTVAGIGSAVLVGGVVLVLTSPEQKSTVGFNGVTPILTAHAGGLAVQGAW